MARRAGKQLGQGLGRITAGMLPTHAHHQSDIDGLDTQLTGTVFTETWDNATHISQWTNTGSGELTISTDSNSGGNALLVTDGASIVVLNRSFHLDPEKLYKVSVVAKVTAGTCKGFFGVAGRNKDDDGWENDAGNDILADMYYVAADDVVLTSTYTLYEGYFKGKAASGNGGQAPSVDDPATLHDDAYWFRPHFRIDFAVPFTGTVLIDSFTIQEIDQQLDTKSTIEQGITLSTGFLTNTGGTIELDFTNKRIWVNNEAITTAGVQMGEYSSAFQLYAGDGVDQFVHFDGSALQVGRDSELVGVPGWNTTTMSLYRNFLGSHLTSTAAITITSDDINTPLFVTNSTANTAGTAEGSWTGYTASVLNSPVFNIRDELWRGRMSFQVGFTAAGNGQDHVNIEFGKGSSENVAPDATYTSIGVQFYITTGGAGFYRSIRRDGATTTFGTAFSTSGFSNFYMLDVVHDSANSYTWKLYSIAANTGVRTLRRTETITTSLPPAANLLTYVNSMKVVSTNVAANNRQLTCFDFIIQGL